MVATASIVGIVHRGRAAPGATFASRQTVLVSVGGAGAGSPRYDRPAPANGGAALPETAAHALTIVGGLVGTIAKAANSQALSVDDGGCLFRHHDFGTSSR